LHKPRIIEGTYTDYICLFGDHRTAYADLCARAADSGSGALYILLDEKGPCGYLAQTDEGDTDRIAQIFTVPERRGEGAAKLLIAEALKRSDKELWINLTEDAAHFAPLDKLIRKAGFWVGNVSTSFRSGIEKDLSHWEKFMQKKGNRLCALIERLGFIAYSFSEAPAEFIDALYNSSYNEYGNRLDVRPFFDNEGRALDRDMSFLLVHAGEQGKKLAAYSLIIRPDERSAVFEHLSAAPEFQNTGCIFLAVARSMEAFQKKGCNRAAYTVYADNKRAHAFSEKVFGRVTVSSHRTIHYMFRRKNIDTTGAESLRQDR